MFLRRKGMLWLVVADGHNTRIFAQSDRSSPLALVGESAQVDGEGPRDRPYRTHDAMGRRHGLAEADKLKAARQERFLGGIADLINGSASEGNFEHLVLVAPSKALGMLRAALKADALKHVRAEFTLDLTHMSAPDLADWLARVEPETKRSTAQSGKGVTRPH
ncbi:MAG: host attachment protein [Glycocaulis sp.]